MLYMMIVMLSKRKEEEKKDPRKFFFFKFNRFQFNFVSISISRLSERKRGCGNTIKHLIYTFVIKQHSLFFVFITFLFNFYDYYLIF